MCQFFHSAGLTGAGGSTRSERCTFESFSIVVLTLVPRSLGTSGDLHSNTGETSNIGISVEGGLHVNALIAQSLDCVFDLLLLLL
jgi:hypothetical protein